MYKQLRFLTTMLLLAVCCGTWAQEVFYTLTPANGSNNSYTGNCDVTIDGITWNVTGNSQMQPWRIGGKSITGVDRTVYSKTAMGSSITKVELSVGAASSITVNSLKLLVASDASFNNQIDEVTATFAANSTINFTPTNGTEWATGAYYKFIFNVTVSGSSNKFVEFSSAKFYKNGSGETPTVAVPVFSPAAGAVAYGTSVSLVQADAFLINYTTDGSDPTWDNGKDIDSNPITITRDITIKARAYDRDQNASSIVTAEYTVLRPDAPTFSPAAGAVEEGTTVTISGRPTGGKIIYTTDGTNPSYSGNIGTVYVDGDVITINQAMTIKAIAVDANDFESSVASASYTIYDPNVPGTQNNPYTVAQAIENTPSTGTSDNVYIQGIVSSFHENDIVSDGSNYRYYISDDGTTENELLVYKGKGLNQATFTNADDLMVGDRVIIYGGLTTYKNTKEIAADNYIVSLTRKTLTSIALSGTYPTTFVEGSTFSHEGIVVTATYDDNSTEDVTAKATFSEPDMTQVGQQTVTVTYQEKTATYTITITALPTHTATFSVEGLTTTQDFKEGAAIVFPTVTDRNGFTFVGWVTSTINGTQSTAPEMVTNATMGTADVTYYAVFAKGSSSSEPTSATISYETEGVPESYGTANEFSECTLDGIKFMIQQMYKNGEKLQWRANGNSNGTGTMYNVDALNKIQSIVLTYDSGDSHKNFTVNVGNSVNPSEGTSIEPTSNENVYTFDCSENNVNYFVLANGTNAGYLTSIVINYLNETSNYADYCTTIPVPSITVTPTAISADAAGETANVTVTYEYVDLDEADVEFYTSSEATATTTCNWVHPTFDANKNVELVIDANSGAARNAYMKVYSMDNETNFVYSEVITITQEATPSLTINIASACTDGNNNYYGTFYSDKAYIMDDMLEGQVVRVDANGKLVVETAYEGGDIVPANTALLIYAVEPGSYNVYTTTAAGDDWSQYNMLKGTLTADEMTVGENCQFYRLTMHNGTQIGFWWGAENGGAFKPGVNKAYLAVPANQAKDGFAFGNDGDATSISTIGNGQLTMENGYNLQGQKVGSEYKGIVIVNGKKFINK